MPEGRPLVMLIDDAGSLRLSMAGFLEEAGFEVAIADGAAAAGMDGRSARARAFFVSGRGAEETLELLESLRSDGGRDPSAPVFYYASPPFVAAIYRAMERGAACCLPFPWDPGGTRGMLRAHGLAPAQTPA